MKLLRLDLLAFGPFTGQTLEFAGGSGLHIVHGRNEAGKSSSLRALRNLLYGIPARSADDFVHPKPSLRIGGVFEADDGTRLEFIRRKGNTKTLRGPDDVQVFDEARLERLLGRVDEQTFRQRFGIDYAELRRGGQSIVEGGGDLKEVLFAAGAGVADLRTIQQQLEEEGSDLFKPRGSSQRITKALTELQEARKAIRQAQLPTLQWVEHDKALQQAEKQLKEIDAELAGRRAERSRLARVGNSLPLIGQLKPLRERLACLADVPLLPDTFAGERGQSESKLENARHDAELAAGEIKRLEEQLADVVIPAELLAHRTAITQLHTDLGIYQQAAADRPRLVAERDAAQKSAGELLEQLGRPLPLAEVETLRLPKLQRKRIQDLAVEWKALVDRQQAAELALRKIDGELQKVAAQLKELPAPRDASDLERTIRRIDKHGDLDAQRQCLEQTLQTLREGARVQLARLPLFSGTAGELERLPVPPLETIERFENELADARSQQQRCQEKIDELLESIRQAQEKLDALRLKGEVPTEADLQDARRRRDAGWDLVQQALRGGSSKDDSQAAAFIEEFAAGGDLAAAFRAAVDAADSLSDRLRREAGRVAEKAGLTAGLQQSEADLAQARLRLTEAEQQLLRVQQQWEAQWQPAGIPPLTPREMRSWRTQQQALIQTAEELRTHQSELDALAAQIAAHRQELEDCLEALERPQIPDGESLAASLESCLQIVEQIRSQARRRQQLTDQQQRLTDERPELDQQAAQAREQLEEWRRQWSAAVSALCLDADAKPAEASAVIDMTDEVLRWIDESRKLDSRLEEMREYSRQFEQSVRQLVEQVAPDLLESLDLSVPQTVGDLVDRLSRAEKDQTKADGWQEQLHQQKLRLAQADVQIKRWQQTLDRLCEQSGCSTSDQLPQAEQQSRSRQKAEAELQSLQLQLCQLAAGAELEQWIAVVEGFDSDQVQADLARLDDSIERLEQQKQQVAVDLGAHKNELDRMDGSGRAAEAQLQAEHLLAGIRSDAEEYIRLRLASAVLSRAMERFRQASQGPVLERAAELFTTLTLGSFTGLRPDYDAGGNAVLVGVRVDGLVVPTSGMSDGTCDQLYLALRIALLESSLAGREPLPFIVDDILIMFDDARAAAALNVLSKLAQKTQVIFFTHHAHLVDVARDVLDGELHVHELGASPVPIPA